MFTKNIVLDLINEIIEHLEEPVVVFWLGWAAVCVCLSIACPLADGRRFRSGRELAAWIGLVPRQYTTGGKPRLGGIGRRANHYLRRQMIHGARAVMFRLTKHDDRRSQWLKGLAARRGFNRAVVALANKTARIAWAVLTRQEDYVALA